MRTLGFLFSVSVVVFHVKTRQSKARVFPLVGGMGSLEALSLTTTRNPLLCCTCVMRILCLQIAGIPSSNRLPQDLVGCESENSSECNLGGGMKNKCNCRGSMLDVYSKLPSRPMLTWCEVLLFLLHALDKKEK